MTSNEELLTLIKAEIAGKIIQSFECENWFPKGKGWDSTHTYRIKPEPREWIVNVGNSGMNYFHDSKIGAKMQKNVVETFTVREVIEDEL